MKTQRGLVLLPFFLSLTGLVGDEAPAAALASRTSCASVYYTCLDNASQLDAFWRRSAAGWNCYGDLAACVRDLIF
jgi:hypothetical protein